MPLDGGGARKLKVLAEENIWGASIILIIAVWNGIERDLKNLTINRIRPSHEPGFKGKGHLLLFPSRISVPRSVAHWLREQPV